MEPILTAATYEMPDGTHEVEISHPAVSRRFTANQLSDYITALVSLRQQLAPAHQMDLPPVTNMQNVADAPPWATFYDEMNDRTALLLRHPGFGWIGYSMGMNQVDDMIPALERIRSHRNDQRKNPN